MSMPLLLVALLSVLATTVVSGTLLGGGTFSFVSAEDCADPLSCWLASLVFKIPDACFDAMGNQFCISELECRAITIAGIDSAYVAPTGLSADMTGIGTHCQGKWSYPHMGGAMDVEVSDAAVSTALVLGKEGVLPTSLSFPSCSIPDIDIELKFSGGIVDWLLQLVSPIIERAIEKNFNKIICETVEPQLQDVITTALVTTIDPMLEQLMASQSAAGLDTSVRPGLVLWNESMLGTLAALETSVDLGGTLNAAVDTLTDGTGVLQVPLNDTHFVIPVVDPVAGPLGNVTVILHSVVLQGMDSFGDVALLQPTPPDSAQWTPYSIYSGLQLASLGVELNVTLHIDLDQGSLKGTDLTEAFLLSLHLSQLEVGIDLFAPLSSERLAQLYLDQLAGSGLACALTAVEQLNVTSLVLEARVDELRLTPYGTIAGSLEEDIDALIDNILLLAVDGFPELISGALSGVMQGPVRTAINDKLFALKAEADGVCAAHVEHPGSSWVTWSANSIISMIDGLLNERIGSGGMNQIMAMLTNGTGVMQIQIPKTSPLLAGWSIDLAGLMSFFRFSLLYPLQDREYALDNMLGVGGCPEPAMEPETTVRAACPPLKLEVEGFRDSVHTMLGVELSRLYLFMDTEVRLNVNALLDLSLGSLVAQPTACLTSSVDELTVNALNVSLADVVLDLKEDQVQVDMMSMVDSLLGSLSDPATLDKINDAIAGMFSGSAAVCKEGVTPSTFDDGSEGPTVAWKVEMAGLITACVATLVGLVYLLYMKFGSGAPPADLKDGEGKAEAEEEVDDSQLFLSNAWLTERINLLFEWEGDQAFCYDALFGHTSIPLWVRVLFPVAVIANIYLFISSNLAVGASVRGLLMLGNREVDMGSVFQFGLADTVRDMWDAKVYPLAVLIAFFSGAWPYIKLVSMLVSWMLPSTVLHVPLRDKVLIWLDILGKWSLLDTYVLVLMMVAFKMDLLVADGIEVVIFVKPEWGFYSFLLATMTSLGLGHILLAFHRGVCETKVPEEVPDGPKEAVMDHCFAARLVSEEGSDAELHFVPKKIRFTSVGKVCVVLGLLLCLLAVGFGTTLETFSFSFKGLTGMLMGAGAEAPYSLVSIGEILPEASRAPHDFGIRWIQVSYFAFALVMPLAFLLAVLVLWVTPLNLMFQKTLVVFTEVLNAWNALDVFVVSIVAALLEIQQFAAFIVGDKCDAINEVLKEYYDEELDGDDLCFDVVATLNSNAWLLYLSAALLVIAGLGMLQLCHNAVAERLDVVMARPQLSISSRNRSTSMSSCEAGLLGGSLAEAAEPLLDCKSTVDEKTDGDAARSSSVTSSVYSLAEEVTWYNRLLSFGIRKLEAGGMLEFVE